jgi:hypothetical protein
MALAGDKTIRGTNSMKVILLVWSLILIVQTIGTAGTECRKEPTAEERNSTAVRSEKSHGAYVAKSLGVDRYGALQILKNGRQVYFVRKRNFLLESGENSIPEMGTDTNGDGIPNLVVVGYSGGAHCCFKIHLFEIGEKFRHLQDLDVRYGGASFLNLDKDAALEIVTADWSYAYAWYSFPRSPSPRVILKWDGTRYSAFPELMRKAGPAKNDLMKMAKTFQASDGWEEKTPPHLLTREIMDLIYTGKMEAARNLYDLSWPMKIAGKKEFAEDMDQQLKASLFWPAVRQLNNGMTFNGKL